MNEETQGEFSVCQFLAGDVTEYVRRNVGPEEAVRVAHDFCHRPAARIGIIQRVIITDGGDNICFEWKFGEGVTFPERGA